MATFPSFTPSSREFSLGEYPVRTFRSLAGTTLRRVFGNRASGYTLRLEFANVAESTVNSIYDHYHGQQGGALGFPIPDSVFGGYSSGLRSRIQNPASVQWFYEQAPTVRSVLRDRSTITVNLIAEIT